MAKPPIDTVEVDQKRLNLMSVPLALLSLFAGLAIFYVRYPYIEDGHLYLAGAFVLGCVGIFFSIRSWNQGLLIFCILFAGAVQLYSIAKFDWRQEYIERAVAGKPFPLEEYIDRYPTFEEYTFDFLGAPDWVRFNDECVQTAFKGQGTIPRCSSLELIQKFYRIDLVSVMTTHFNRMKSTAMRIKEGQLKKRGEYAQCIADKGCATISLLPQGVNAENIDPSSQDFINIRQAFWSLVNDKKMSKQVCELNFLCSALVAMKVVDPRTLPF